MMFLTMSLCSSYKIASSRLSNEGFAYFSSRDMAQATPRNNPFIELGSRALGPSWQFQLLLSIA